MNGPTRTAGQRPRRHHRAKLILASAAIGIASLFVTTAPSLAAGKFDMGEFDRDVFFFGGAFENQDFGHAFNPFGDNYNGDWEVGGGYQQFFARWGGFRLGGEAGAALRFSNSMSAEVWGGVVGRYDGLAIGPLHISPAFTAGFSAVSGYISSEANQIPALGRGVPLLYFLGPEINFSLDQYPNVEAFWRIQHRSGGYGSIAKIDAANADVVGLRFKF